jgi:O-antigen/teichoic acid export membrane protein
MSVVPGWRRWTGGIGGGAFFVTFWQAQRVVLQAVWLVLVARLLGAEEFGQLAGLLGLAAGLGGLSGLGYGLVMFRDVVRDRALTGERWRTLRQVTLLSGVVLGLVFVGASQWLGPDRTPFVALASIAVAEMIAFPLTAGGAFAFAAHERMGWSAALPALMAFARLLAMALVWWRLEEVTLLHVAVAHGASSVLTAIASLVLVDRVLRPVPGRLRLAWRHFLEGLGFCWVWAGTSMLGSLDKAIVLRWGGGEVAGLYSVVYRLAAMFAMPIEALTTSASPRLFRAAAPDDDGGRLARRLALAVLAYCALAAVVIWFLAPLVPLLFGAEYQPAVAAVRGMIAFVPLFGLRTLGGNVLLGRGQAALLARFQLVALAVMFGAGVLLVPRYGLWGAVAAAIATEAALCLAVWNAIRRLRRHGSP